MEATWTRVSAFVLCRDGSGRILLTRFAFPGHPDHGKWTLPGGRIEWGESPAEAALRELHEESGLHATVGGVIGVFMLWLTAEKSVRGEPGLFVAVVHTATEVGGELREDFDADNTTDAAAWFSLEEIETLPHVELVDFAIRHEVVDGA